MKKHSIIVRSWQKGAGHPEIPFKQRSFDTGLRASLELMLKTSNSDLARIVVVTNTDQRFPKVLGEAVGDDSMTPTMRALKDVFGSDIDVLSDAGWGNNAGSASALNIGWQHAAASPETSHVLSWNPEMALTGHHVAMMRHFMYEHCLEICGYLREWHWERPQFGLFQNTAAMYRIPTLQEVVGFDPRCDGNDGATIETEAFGAVTLAGMDDQDFLLRLVKARSGDIPRIGMIGRSNPAPWKTQWPDDPVRQQEFDIKVARQMSVLRAWSTLHLPHMTLEEYLGQVFREMFIGS